MNKITLKDINATIHGAATFFLKRYAGPFKSRRKWLERTQWFSECQLQALQLALLKRMIEHSYKTVPYYTKLMNRLDLIPEDIKTLDDIKKFPVMRKSDVKKAADELVSRKFNTLFLRTAHTGGTTGLPVPLRRDLWSIGDEHAFVRRQFDWAGIGMRQRCAYLEGRVVKSQNSEGGRFYYFDAAMQELSLSVFHLSAKTSPFYAQAMKSYGTKVLIAYPSAAYVLAKGCLENGISLPLQCVLTTSETLDDGKKRIIAKAFDCRVFDFYGCAERVCYIHTCEQGSYHIIPEYGLTELMPAEPPNQDCYRIVATGFWNMTMPLIRYDIGDLLQLSPAKCRCGRNFPVVKKIFGRDGNFITTPSGRVMGASAIECILARILYRLYDMPIAVAQVINGSDGAMMLEYVPMDKFNDKDADKLREIMREGVPAELEADIRKVDHINRTPRGKFVSFVMGEHH